jgi:hypothetical protein
MLKAIARWTVIGAAIVLVAIQAVPYGRNHTNPPVRREPPWALPQARALAVRACYDCHSNETVWPWFSSIAPFSWLIQNDVDEGRRKLNFSEWERPQPKARESARKVQEWEMPPLYYVPLHPKSWFFGDTRAALIQGLVATFGQKAQAKGMAQRNPAKQGS